MTKEEILAMKPGRELDELIAKNVMDKELCEEYRFHFWIRPMNCINPIPYYSTDISAAFEIVEKMRTKGVFIDINTEKEFYTVGGYSEKYQDEIEMVEFKTAPESICKAALLAVTA